MKRDELENIIVEVCADWVSLDLYRNHHRAKCELFAV